MNRRELILSAMSLVTLVSNPLDVLAFGKPSKNISAQPNRSVIVESGQTIELPLNPSNNDVVHIVVPPRALRTPSKVVSSTSKILNKNESLELDQVSNFKLKYNSMTNSWS